MLGFLAFPSLLPNVAIAFIDEVLFQQSFQYLLIIDVFKHYLG
jgi:hypothetical protein